MACPFGTSSRAGSSVSRSPFADGQLPAPRSTPVTASVIGMLDLQPRVHFQEVKAAVFVEQELDGAGVRVADALRHGSSRRRDGGPLRGVTASDGVSSTTFW